METEEKCWAESVITDYNPNLCDKKVNGIMFTAMGWACLKELKQTNKSNDGTKYVQKKTTGKFQNKMRKFN